MPIPLIIAAALGIAATLAVLLWPTLLNWAKDSLLPWVDEHLPGLSEVTREAFATIDNVVVSVRNAVKASWATLREHLLKTMLVFERSGGVWTKVITSWLMKDKSSQKITQTTTREEVPWDELPGDVRDEALRKGMESKMVPISKQRDKELKYQMAS